jgi:tRNA pseudouridine55 synthase
LLIKPGVLAHTRWCNVVRKLFPGVKTGHSGTLDPMATGVLPVCLGKGTRLVEYIIELPKKYRASVTFGKTTDTEDATGTVTSVQEVPFLEKKEIETDP